MTGLTLTEMANVLGVPQRTVERRIQRAGIKPLTKEAIYPPDTLNKIRDAKVGRPKKAAPEPPEPESSPTEPRKASKSTKR